MTDPTYTIQFTDLKEEDQLLLESQILQILNELCYIYKCKAKFDDHKHEEVKH